MARSGPAFAGGATWPAQLRPSEAEALVRPAHLAGFRRALYNCEPASVYNRGQKFLPDKLYPAVIGGGREGSLS
jgi:hypothetical protein